MRSERSCGGVDHRPIATDRRAPACGCYSDGEASLPVRKELASGETLTSALGYSLNYNTLDNNKNPTDGLLVDFQAGFRRRRRRRAAT